MVDGVGLTTELDRLPQITDNRHPVVEERVKRRPNRTSIRTFRFNHPGLKNGMGRIQIILSPPLPLHPTPVPFHPEIQTIHDECS